MKHKSPLQKTKSDSQKNVDEKDPKISLKANLFKGLLFVFCAIPGLFLFLIYSLWLAASIFTPKMENPPLLLTPLIMAAGIVLMLIGTGKLKEFKYSAVFLFIPISFIIYGFLAEWRILGSKSIDIALFVGLTLLFVNSLVIMHYQKRVKGKRAARDKRLERRKINKEKGSVDLDSL